MVIDRKLTLVIPVDTDKGEAIVRSSPVSAAFFRRHFLVISKTFARLHNEGLGITAAPRIAAMMLAHVEREQLGLSPDDEAAPASPIMAEIGRRTMVTFPGDQSVPWDQVVSAKMLTEDDIEEVQNAIVFFTVASSMYHRRDAEEMISGAARLWGARLESSTPTGSPNSSPTSNANANSGATGTRSSFPV